MQHFKDMTAYATDAKRMDPRPQNGNWMTRGALIAHQGTLKRGLCSDISDARKPHARYHTAGIESSTNGSAATIDELPVAGIQWQTLGCNWAQGESISPLHRRRRRPLHGLPGWLLLYSTAYVEV